MESLFYVERRDDTAGSVHVDYSQDRHDYPTLVHAMQAAREHRGWVQIVSTLEDGDYRTAYLYPGSEIGDWSTCR